MSAALWFFAGIGVGSALPIALLVVMLIRADLKDAKRTP